MNGYTRGGNVPRGIVVREFQLMIFFFFPLFFCHFFFHVCIFKGNLTEWNPDKITSARQAQMREWSSSLLLITVLWTSTKIKLLHENTEYRQDNLSVYNITSNIMPRIMQVPRYRGQRRKVKSTKGPYPDDEEGSEIYIFLRRLLLEAQQASWNTCNSQGLHFGDVRKSILCCPLRYQLLNNDLLF